ncbi:MAG: SymE family type I addiction module toxin [Pseudomonadota bacterium]|nr:SymE family type I addiction module toxin [Pseudomonadota bacterium]
MVDTHSIPAPSPAQDRISPDFTPISVPGQEVRRYTVTASRRDIRGPEGRPVPAPMLHLVGAWMKRAGFTIGRSVTIQVSEGRLVIELAEPEHVPQAEALARIAQAVDGDLPKRDLDRFVRELKRCRPRRPGRG